jgi:hypothetical protein
MLFEAFNITIMYRECDWELEIREIHRMQAGRHFEVIQGGISIVILMFENGEWQMYLVDDLHPIVKQDTENFVSPELVELLIQAIVNYYDCFTDRKILKYQN